MKKNSVFKEIIKLFYSSPNGLLLINAKDYRPVLINKSFITITGLSEKVLMARSVFETEIFLDKHQIISWIKRITNGEPVRGADARIKTIATEIKDVIVSFEFMETDDEKLIFIIMTDISERKKYERVLNRFKQIFEISNDLTAIVDKDFVYRFANETYYQTFGKKHGEIVGQSVEDVLGKKAFQRTIKEKLERALKGETVRYQFWLNAQNRDHFMDVTYKPFYDENGFITGVLSSAHDITSLKLSEMQAIENERKYKNLFNNSEVGMFRTRLDGTEILEYNEKLLKILNYKQDEIIGNPSINLWADKKEREIMVQGLMANGRITNYECKIINKQQKVLRCLTSSVFYPETGIIEGSVIDITDRKKAEEELIKAKETAEENEARNKLIIDNIPVIIWKTGRDGKTVYIGENIERFYGFTPEEIYKLGRKSWLDRIHPDDIKYVEKQLNGLFDNNKPFEVEYRIKNNNGKWIWLHDISNKVTVENGIQYAYGVFYDVTDRKKIENELIESEDKYQKAFMASPVPMFISTLDEGRIVEVNSALLSMFKYSSEELIGKTRDDLHFVEIPRSEKKEFLNLLKSDGRIQDRELTIVSKDGTNFDCIINGELLNINNTPYVFTIINNISEIKKANKELKFYKSKLEDLVERRTKELKNTQQKLMQSEKMASIGLLSAGIAHEINNPINYISGGVTGLKKSYEKLKGLILSCKEDGLGPMAKGRKHIKDDVLQLEDLINTADKMFYGINEGVEKTKKIINSLHVFSSNSEDKFEEVAIPGLIQSVLLMLFNKYKNRVTIHEKYAKDSIISGIPGKLQQVFMNVLSNAIQAIPDKGEVSINTSWNSAKNKLKISIKDNGIGIPQEVQKKIFDPFYTTKNVGEGTGLGLYLSYTFIEQHSGKIQVKSRKNKGTGIIIELPKEQIVHG